MCGNLLAMAARSVSRLIIATSRNAAMYKPRSFLDRPRSSRSASTPRRSGVERNNEPPLLLTRSTNCMYVRPKTGSARHSLQIWRYSARHSASDAAGRRLTASSRTAKSRKRPVLSSSSAPNTVDVKSFREMSGRRTSQPNCFSISSSSSRVGGARTASSLTSLANCGRSTPFAASPLHDAHHLEYSWSRSLPSQPHNRA
mmetsp:Transcript_29118/g.83595  ORF Transcript_29118/g.83595 Transcript_29118/m.83595 type:complete len:200 (+) Transcript_29118:2167-2766(+)